MRNKALSIFSVLLLIFTLTSCSNNTTSTDDTLVTGIVETVNHYGNIYPNTRVSELLKKGYEYGDIINVKINNEYSFELPFVTNYTDCGYWGDGVCDYMASQEDISIFLKNPDVANAISTLEKGTVPIEFSLAKKAGYLDTYNTVHCVDSTTRKEKATDEEYSNFRMVKGGNIKENVLYRGSSPINFKNNAKRYSIADRLCKKVGIKTIINLGDIDAEVQDYIQKSTSKSSYYKSLYNSHNVILNKLSSKYIIDKDAMKIVDTLKQMLNSQAPFYIHCTHGKDRTGIFCMLLEGLAGATAEEIEADYMETYKNYYDVAKNSARYNSIKKITIDRLIYGVANFERFNEFNFDNVDISNIDIQQAVKNFLIKNGLSEDGVNALTDLITK